MAFKKRKGQVTPNWKRYKDGVEIKPCKLYHSNGSLMVGAIDGEVVVDNSGKPIPFKHLDFNLPT